MSEQIAGFHPTTDCLLDENGDCSFYLMVNNIWFTKDDGTSEDDGYINFSISLFTSSGLIENCENNLPDDGECFPRLGGWKFAFNFCLNGNYNGNGYSPLVIDRVTAAGDNTGFAAGFDYHFFNYYPDDSTTFNNPIFEGGSDTQCLSATIQANAFGGESDGWSLGVDYPGMTLANVRVKYKNVGVDIINPDLSVNSALFPYSGHFGMGGHPYVACYMDGQFSPDTSCEASIDLSPEGQYPPPFSINGNNSNYGGMCRRRLDVNDNGMGNGYYCVGNGIYNETNGGTRGSGFRCRNHVYPQSTSTYKYDSGPETDPDFQAYCNYPDNDSICGYCDANFPLSCVFESQTGFPPIEAYCNDDQYNNTPLGLPPAQLNNCISGNYDCISDDWTIIHGASHPGPSYPDWSSGNRPNNIVFDIVRDNDCCTGDPSIDGGSCIEACSSEMWDINNNYLSSPTIGGHTWTWLPSTWIIHDTDPPHCNNSTWTGCLDDPTDDGLQCCCNNPPFDEACLAIPAWYDIFGCTYPQGCNYNPEATEDIGCDFPYNSNGYHETYYECQRAQGCTRLLYDGDGDGLVNYGSKYFCAQTPKELVGYACITLSDEVELSYPIFPTEDECLTTCGEIEDPIGIECKPIWSFGKKESLSEMDWDGWDGGINGNSLNTTVLHTCEPNVDYSDFARNHCEARGDRAGASPHRDFICSHDSCFTDRYYQYGGDPYPDCEYNSWECNPNCGGDPGSDECNQGICKPPYEIMYFPDNCGVCGGDGSACSAYGSCDQSISPYESSSDYEQCLIWGNEVTWDPFHWPHGCGNSYCFSQMLCPGGNKYTTDDICFEWGAKFNQSAWCEAGEDCHWDCNNLTTGMGDPNSRCGCTYPDQWGTSSCSAGNVSNDPLARWGGQATCDGIGKVAWPDFYCEVYDDGPGYDSYVGHWTGETFYWEDGVCYMDKTPYCGWEAPVNGLGCACDARCAWYFDCCHGAKTHCSETWKTGKIYVPLNSYPNAHPAVDNLLNNQGLWPFGIFPDETSWYDLTGFDASLGNTYQMIQAFGDGGFIEAVYNYIGTNHYESSYGICMLSDGTDMGSTWATWIPCEYRFIGPYNYGCTDYTEGRYC